MMEYDLSITDMTLENVTASWDEVLFNYFLSQSYMNLKYWRLCLSLMSDTLILVGISA